MGEAVLIWQAVIFLTIALGGNKRGLVIAFWVVWTIFQVLALWLSVLQFGTIWLAWAIFGNNAIQKNTKSSTQIDTTTGLEEQRCGGIEQSPSDAKRIASPNAGSSIPSSAHLLSSSQPNQARSSWAQAFNDGLLDINRNLSRVTAVQAATSDLNSQLSTERLIIEGALKSAQSRIEREEKMKDPRFKEAYEKFARVFSESPDPKKTSGESSHIKTSPPNFQRGQPHPDNEFELAIQESFDALRKGREAFLLMIHGQLSHNATLRRHFLFFLKELDGDRYLLALDPTSSWTPARADPTEQLSRSERLLAIRKTLANTDRIGESTANENIAISRAILTGCIEKAKENPKARSEQSTIRSSTVRSTAITPEEFLRKFEITCFYHFTDTRNLESIKAHGGILPWSQVKGKVLAPGGNDWSHDADAIKGHDQFVHLCLLPVHPMEFVAKRDGRIQESRFLRIDTSIIHTPGILFCPDIGNKSGVPALQLTDAISKMDFEIISPAYNGWLEPPLFERRKRACKYEMLVPCKIPLSLISGF